MEWDGAAQWRSDSMMTYMYEYRSRMLRCRWIGYKPQYSSRIIIGVESPKIVRHSSQNVGMLPVNKQR